MPNLKIESVEQVVPGPISRLSKRDLEMVSTTFGGKYCVTIHETKEGFWTIAVKFEGRAGLFSIETARGNKMKVWRHLAGAIAFVQESCPHAHDVVVKIGNWNLCRLKEHDARNAEVQFT